MATTDPVDQLLDTMDLQADLKDVELDRQQILLLKAISRLVRQNGVDLMALIDDVKTLVTATGADAQAAADRVLAAVATAQASTSAQIADLQTQVQTLIDGNASDITPAQLQEISDGLTGIDTTVKGIAPEAPPVA